MRVTAYASLAALLAAMLTGCSDQPAEEASEAATATAESTAAPEVSGRTQAIQTSTASIDGARISKGEAGNWLSTGRTYDEQRHSPLTQINDENIGELGLEWYWDTGTKRGLEATPIVVDGVMFTSGTWSVVWAHDAKTGELLWEYDPEVPEVNMTPSTTMGVASRPRLVPVSQYHSRPSASMFSSLI